MGHLAATGITSFQKTRPHKAACTVGLEMSLSVLLQFRARVAVGKMKLSIEIPSFYMKMENNPLLLKTFTVNNQLDRDFYIRGRHEGTDNSLCKS